MTSPRLFDTAPPIIAALHLPDFARNRHLSLQWLEDYAVTNARIFADAGIPWVKVQDQTRTAEPATADTVAMLTAIARTIRSEVPGLGLGIIVEAHDPHAALAVAHATGADFVRLKVFVGGAMTADGPRYGLGAEATEYRARLGRTDIAILADVHDRTARPLSDETQPFAAGWAAKVGADGLIVTGSSFDDTVTRIAAVRQTVGKRPILIGGGVTTANVGQALKVCDGLIVSSALMRKDAGKDDLVQWDGDVCRWFMDAVRSA